MKAIDYANSILDRGTILEMTGFKTNPWFITCGYCGRNEMKGSYEESEEWLTNHYQKHIEDES